MKINIDNEIQIAHLREKLANANSTNQKLLKVVRKIERERDAVLQFGVKSLDKIPAIRAVNNNRSEATAIVLCSDWHIEETVKSASVSGLNEYSLEIAKERSQKFWRTLVRMVHIFKKDIPIPTIVLWLGGDFISGNIHEELLEICSLPPVEASIMAQNWLAEGIEYLLEHTDCKIIIPCSVGNHSRMTKETRHSTEIGNSLELFIYHALAQHFSNRKRIKFIIPEGYHTYLQVYGKTLRFHHGHGTKYQGGIGGIFIPAFKAISQWNKGRVADLDLFGHYHSAKDGGTFVLNGSLIGYNAYALSIKADFETPRQMFFLVDNTRGKTITTPIIV